MKFSVVTPLWQDRSSAENLDIARTADQLGYPELWIGEMATYDAFAFATAAGLHTQQIALTLGPLAVSVRTPTSIAMGVASVANLTGRPTAVALGASSTLVVEAWHGRPRRATARLLADTAHIVKSLLAGEKVQFEGEQARCSGYRLRLEAPHSPLTIAAFGPAAIEVAGRHADRLVLNMVTPQSLATLRGHLAEAAQNAGRPTPKVAVWLCCAVSPAAASITQIQRALVGYLAAPGYAQMFTEAGFGELVTYAQTAPHPRQLLEAMPADLPAAIGLVGSEQEIRARVSDYRSAGADEICLVPATADDPAGRRSLTMFAPKPPPQNTLGPVRNEQAQKSPHSEGFKGR